MSNSAKSRKTKLHLLFWLGLAVVLFAFVITWPLHGWRVRQSADYVQRAIKIQSTNPSEALTLLRFASTLDRSNEQAWQESAIIYENAKNADGAISMLEHLRSREAREHILRLMLRSGQYTRLVQRAGEYAKADNSPRYSIYVSQAQLELDQPDAAIKSAEQATQNSVGDHDIQLQLGLAYLVAGKNKQADSLISTLSPSEALETLKDARAAKYTLATALYEQGLLRSSERVLAGESSRDLQSSLLLATTRLVLYPSDKQKLMTAKGDLEQATGEYPADIKLHQLLKTVYEKLGDTAGASKQQDLIDRLTTGRV